MLRYVQEGKKGVKMMQRKDGWVVVRKEEDDANRKFILCYFVLQIMLKN